MPNNINKIKLPNGTICNLQDANALHYIGKTSTALTDGATTNPITINSVNVTAVANDYVLANGNSNNNFYFNGTSWVLMDPVASSSGVTSVGVGNTSHLTVDPVAGTGNVTIDIDTGYSIPLTASQTSWSQKSAGIKASNGTSTEVIADSTYYTTLVAGSNVSILGADSGADQGKITISATDTTYENKTAASGGTDVSLVTTGDKYKWDNKQSSIKVGSSAVADANHVTTFAEGANVDITAENGTITIAATDTTYSTFDATHAGLAPAGGTTTGFLKNDGTWATPTDTTYTGTGAIDVNNTTHVISVADGDIATKGVVQIKNSVGAASSASESLVVTEKAVASAIEALPEPMVFKGGITLTAANTDTTKCSITLPSGVSSIKAGYTFKVISIASSPTYTGTLKVGDTFVADKASAKTTSDWVENTDWSVIPSGDEPSGTVTEVAATDGITTASGSAISSTGTVKLNMVSSHTITGQSASAITTTSNRTYPVGLDANNKVAVNIPWTDTTYEFADSYNASTNKGATVATVTNAIGALDVSGTTTFGAGKTISAWSETDGKVSIASQDISITGSQINDIDTSMPTTAVDTKVPSTKLVKTQLSGKQDTLTFDGTYSATTNKAATVSTVTNAINALDVTGTASFGAAKTIATWTETDGKVSITSQNISIPIAQVSDVTANTVAVTSVSTTATTSESGYISVSSYDSTTKTLTLKGILAPTANNFVKKS